ncbi:MAG TPA: oligoendopeptidase F [Gaiellaceae bacterium]|nr:oligoendopeptidase F [Gaiellaceae bacterium]
MTEIATPPRSELPVERTWDAESVFASAAEWEAALEDVVADLPRLEELAGRLAEGPDVTLAALVRRDDLVSRLGRVFVYPYLEYAVETTDQAAVARLGRAQTVYGRVLAAIAFVEPELLALGRDRLAEWAAADSAFHPYSHYLDDLFRRGEHVRSSEIEELLGGLVDAREGVYSIYSGLVDSDLSFAAAHAASGETVEVTQGSIHALLASPDRTLRQGAWESYADGYRSVRNTLAATYVTSIKQDVFSSSARRHESTRAAALHAPNIPVEVFDDLLAAFERNLATWHRYWGVRASLLGIDAVHTYDLWAPLGADPPQFEYEQCVDWICDSLAPLGDEYVATVRRGCLEERWIDVYPNQGKVGGAFSAGVQGTKPFIVMSFDGTAVSLGTLAHELGHSMHSYLSWETQPPISARYSLFLAEVASNFHQVLLRDHLLEAVADREIQLAVLDEALANFHRYFFVMPTLARFEREMHERVEAGDGVTADLLDERMADLFAEAYGPGVEVDRERDGITWAQFSHLYAPFYVYQYATGISGAHALARGVLDGDPGAADRYLGFLRAGGSAYPLDVLRAAGVDLASPEPVEATFAVLASLVDRLESLAA